VLEALRKRIERVRLFAQAARSTHVVQPVRPAAIAEFVRGASRVPYGPHLAVMFHAAAHPEREALVEYDAAGRAPRRMTWRELDAAINRLGNALIARGAAGGSRVALMLPNGSEYLIAQQALARIGATAVQIGYRLKAAEIAYILANAEPQATLVHAAFLDAMTEARAQAGERGGALIIVGDAPDAAPAPGAPGGRTEPRSTERATWDRALAAASPAVPSRGRGGDGGGVIVYTSGTTGKSKGAHRSYRTTGLESVADLVLQLGVRADDRHLVVCPLYHSAAPAFVVMLMSLGATIVLMNHFDPAGALEIIAREQVTCSLMVPTMIVRITNLPAEARAAHATASLRWVMSVAAPLSTEAARRFMAQFGPVLWNFYGATETGMVTLAGPGDHVTRPGTIGRALRGNEIRLLDAAGHEVPDGAIGELYVRNEMLISGYHKNAEATREAQRDGLFSVGDLARRDADGYYYLESRTHDMVISGGTNIYPREIEDHLLTHPAILDAAVIGVPDPEWGETLRAFIVVREGHAVSADEVIAYCRAGLADFKRPREVRFVAELPRNPTGKILKRELRDLP
jgi:fatty-acyl-CoA synthase